jgi:hypothetical protein
MMARCGLRIIIIIITLRTEKMMGLHFTSHCQLGIWIDREPEK